MIASEGLRRTVKVVRWLGIVFAGLALAVGLFEAIEPAKRGNRLQMEAIVVGVTVAIAVYFTGTALTWIMEGFAVKKDR